MKDDKPYVRGRCGVCLRPFKVEEKPLRDGGLRVTLACEPCGRRELVTFTAADLKAWKASRVRRAGP